MQKDFKYKGASPGNRAHVQRLLNQRINEETEYVKNARACEMAAHVLNAAEHVLHDKFGFGDKRMNEFRAGVNEIMSDTVDGYVALPDFTENFKMIEK